MYAKNFVVTVACCWLFTGIARAQSTGVFPPTLGQQTMSSDPTGTVETYNVDAPTDTSSNPFFLSLGTNGRACVTCHEPRSAWGVSAASIQARFAASNGTDPIFRLIDGATCPNDDTSTLAAMQTAYQLLLNKGLIRIFLPVPSTADYQVKSVNDPYNCTNLPVVSMYRRPLPAANLRFLTECPPGQASCSPLSIMWDGREPSFESQATHATLGHAQASSPPTADQLAAIVQFETNVYDAQIQDNAAGTLSSAGASGGPANLSDQEFYIGINDSLGGDPLFPGVFTSDVFNLYDAWQDSNSAAQQAVYRGQELFNNNQFVISNVNGLNRFSFDPLGQNAIVGTCTTCHDSPNVGNHSLKLALNIGVSDANPPGLNVADLPVFNIQCVDGSRISGTKFQVTDPGRALITGHCSDVGKVKGPILRGLAARAPYFHNGSAAALGDVVNFYNQRFSMGLTDQQKSDLVAFLQTL